MAPVPGPYSGVSTLAFVARASALTFGVVYGSIKLSYLKNDLLRKLIPVNLGAGKAKAQKKAEVGHH